VSLLAKSFQHAAVRTIEIKLERALAGATYHTLLCGGGVSANSLLRARLTDLAKKHGLALVLPPLHYCTDNAAMIAGLGSALLRRGARSGLDLQAQPTSAL
jgi:N6-L-threonylcarbamoyladenine synthase